MGSVSVRQAEPLLHDQLEAILGHPDTLRHLLDEATREAAQTVSLSARELQRR